MPQAAASTRTSPPSVVADSRSGAVYAESNEVDTLKGRASITLKQPKTTDGSLVHSKYLLGNAPHDAYAGDFASLLTYAVPAVCPVGRSHATR
ncbi:hypothetical protein KV205_24930 [Streptomyces sp. SKN60]|uniref:hypothetical protein n=1 Tax=Streptomyces sp. SKN60 TaxID=2855506 RepID=UPI002246A198|nr:hypothetical protein [Streptomyces sp. SKN60]MCX2183749.1 hypothetical protein [Streptomyces sp. SKN60]